MKRLFEIAFGRRFAEACKLAPYFARLYPEGTLEQGFLSGMSGPNGRVSGIVIQPQDNKILIWGDFSSVNGTPSPRLARLNPDAVEDTNFVPVFGGFHGGFILELSGSKAPESVLSEARRARSFLRDIFRQMALSNPPTVSVAPRI